MTINYEEFVPMGNTLLVEMDVDKKDGLIHFVNPKTKRIEGKIIKFGTTFKNEYGISIGVRGIFETEDVDIDKRPTHLHLGSGKYRWTVFHADTLVAIEEN